jgi:UvrD-like helicase C-terminal domain
MVIGHIDDVAPDAGEIVVSFDGRSVTYGFVELDMLVPAYATSIHKSQGSEYPAVIIQVLTQHYAMLQRNLLYTGVTEGSGWSLGGLHLSLVGSVVQRGGARSPPCSGAPRPVASRERCFWQRPLVANCRAHCAA